MTHVSLPILWALSTGWLLMLSLVTGPLLTLAGLARPNFRGDRIPVGYGLLILLWCVPVLLTAAALQSKTSLDLLAMAVVAGGMGVLGFIDDRWGDRSRSGLKGHFRAFFIEGVVTTGFMKAVGGAMIGVMVPRLVLGYEWGDSLLDGAIIALSANALNLLDLRPGRAGATFLALAAPLVAAQWSGAAVTPLVFIVIPAIVAYERDARGKVMLGDTGSNLLGGSLGLAVVTALPSFGPRIAVLALLVVLHFVAERVSITKVIKANRVLRAMDRLTGVR